MTAKELLLELIKRQKKNAYRSLDWDKLEPKIKKSSEEETIVYFNSVRIGFAFDKNGRFEGIFNWQE